MPRSVYSRNRFRSPVSSRADPAPAPSGDHTAGAGDSSGAAVPPAPRQASGRKRGPARAPAAPRTRQAAGAPSSAGDDAIDVASLRSGLDAALFGGFIATGASRLRTKGR